ncbi:MAG: penicillin acylase family protein [Anaerolineae bacterium]
MRRIWKALRVMLVVLLVLVLLTPAAGWLFLRRSLPQTTGTTRLAGLTGPVEVVRDPNGIPYIYARSDRDAFFALGYVHAQDRLWQMEMQRRIGADRLSEILGESTVKTDQFLRTLGVYRAAQAAWPGLSAEAQAALQAYADGVNAFLAGGHPLPPEFVILGFKPEPWQPADSLVWAKMMAWNLGDTYSRDIYRAQLTAALGPERAGQLLPGYPAGAPIILPADATASGLQEIETILRDRFGLGGEHIGSNNWVVSGARTASGKPLLANDPHLGAQIPSIWYLASIQGDRIHAVGATLPGLPAIVIGHNADIAWGVTNLGPDVQDLFVERVNPANPNQVEVNGQWVDMTIVAEEIKVKGQEKPIRWAARATRHGPLISDVTSQRGQALALRWPSLDPGDTTIEAFLGINYARNWDDFTAALRQYVAPSQNFVYADRAGNIGYYGPGRIPIRAKGDGSVPVPGWNDEYAWTGWIPFEELPHAYNPKDGYIVTANHRVTPDDYPYFITHDWAAPYRAQRIIELLTAKSGLTPDDFARIQADQRSAQALELLPVLLSVQPETDAQRRALDLLRSWDGVLSADSAAAAIYEAWYAHLNTVLLGDDVGGTLADTLLTGHNPILLAAILGDGNGIWCDDVLTPEREDCHASARVALEEALKDLTERMGKDMAQWRWGNIHRTQFPHNPFSQVEPLKRFFHRSIKTGGDMFTVNPSPYKLAARYDANWVPSYRQIVDLADWENSRFMHTTGQSGHPLSDHYADLIPRWRAVTYVPMHWDRGQVQAAATLMLQPK